MKKQILMVMLIAGLLGGCVKAETATQAEPERKSRFDRVEYTGAWEVVVDTETGVMYAVSRGGYNQGTFTLLVDADGKPLIWKGETDE